MRYGEIMSKTELLRELVRESETAEQYAALAAERQIKRLLPSYLEEVDALLQKVRDNG